MISVKDLSISFADVNVINKISFDVPEKEVLVVLGKNGSGKSVLLKCIAALLPFQSGKVCINDVEVSAQLYEDRSTERSLLGYVFQKGGLFDSMTVAENIAFGMRRRNFEETTIKERISSVLVSVGLEGSDDKSPSELSGGMQKRVSLARSLCLEPGVILYDDPTAGLDPVLTDSIADLILSIRDSASITSVIVTHDLNFAHKVADSVILLYNGEAVCNMTVSEFFSKDNEYARQFIEGAEDGPIDLF
ncbi:MAG: ATP-binding cassette domain-containing protein [Spirochaetes bacterium]|jgi:phospholipid/cholesterol/gamma-HCH transport system ATP-binding protein|nr:ATP-binding cassette domain-containing protein [Spirochaetota bacterium]